MEEDLDSNETIQLMNKFDALLPEDLLESCEEGEIHVEALFSSNKEPVFELCRILITLLEKLSPKVDLEVLKTKTFSKLLERLGEVHPSPLSFSSLFMDKIIVRNIKVLLVKRL